MPEYKLFAARNGETIAATSDQPNSDAAEDWAATQIVQAFGLEWYEFDAFYELAAETDGVTLEEVETALA